MSQIRVHAVPALGQLRPPRKTSRGAPLSASKMEGIGGFTPNTMFIRFGISSIRAIFDERGCQDFH